MGNVVPVATDLTLPESRLNILRGFEKMHRVDHKIGAGVSLELGDWAVLNNNGELVAPGATSVANTYPVIAGNDRFDSKITGQATVVMNSPIIAKTAKMVAGSYNVGSELTVKNLGAGEKILSIAAVGDYVLARVVEVGNGYIVFETVSAHKKA
jgi:hypothetical protein